MLVNTGHFCALSTNPQFLGWLQKFASDVYTSLVEHGRKSSGCSANTQKMLWVLDTISKRPGGEDSLALFLRDKFPHVIVVPKAAIKQSIVFDHYDPTLLTIPRRLILDSEDAARRFLADKPVGEYVVVEERAYIEYLPIELAGLLSQIPAENWRVRAWRAAH